MKTLYMFYMQFNNGMKPMLYAFTDNKKERDEFKLTRDMSLFHEKEIEVTKNRFFEINSYFSNKKLYYHECKTKNEEGRLINVKILMSTDEIHSILLNTEEILPKKFKDIMFDTSVFKDDINESLYHLGYFYIYQWLYMNQYLYVPLDIKFAGFDNELSAIHGSKFTYDEFHLFMYLYGRTMNTKFKI